MRELGTTVNNYEIANYKYQTTEKDLSTKVLDTERLEAEV